MRGGRYPRRSYPHKFWWPSVKGFLGGGGSNFPLSHWLPSSPLQHTRTTVRVCDTEWRRRNTLTFVHSTWMDWTELINWTEQVESYTIVIIISIPSPTHFFIPGLKPSFSANPFHRSLPFLLQDWLHGFPGLFTDTSEHIRFLLFSFFLFSTY